MSASEYTYNVAPNPSDNNAVPVGTIVMFGSATPPTNWLLCDGTAISRSTYSALYNVIGTLYGTGNGTTTFNLPNTTGKTTRGGTGAGGTGGSDTYTLATANIPSHSHFVTQNGANFTGGGGISSLQPSNSGSPSNFVGGAILSPDSTTVVTASGGTPGPYTVTNPFVTIPVIIKYA
jgi:microcystin-dependent protein